MPEQAGRWRWLEACARRRAELHGFGELRTPTFEDVDLFVRGVGQTTDIVEKEIYAFQDKGGDRVALRPEGTASAVRAYLEHGLFNRPQPVKLYSLINTFRYDRPQAGRYREFHQLNCEAIGESDPVVDADLVTLLWRFLEDLGLRDLSLELNSIGDPACRPKYLDELRAYYREHVAELCEDDRRRLETNPLRLLDCKRERCQPIIEAAPRTVDHLCTPCSEHFAALTAYLDDAGLAYHLNPRLVRGLDYYTRTVFEVHPARLGAQSALGGGGRYDGLAEELGGRPTPGVGFAAGLERILLNLEEQGLAQSDAGPDLAFMAPLGLPAKRELTRLADRLRQAGLAAAVGTGDRSLKALMRQANSTGARWAIIMGDQELADRSVNVRDLRANEQRTIPIDQIVLELSTASNQGEGTRDSESVILSGAKDQALRTPASLPDPSLRSG